MHKADITVLKVDNSHIAYIVSLWRTGEESTACVFDDYQSALDFFKDYIEKEII